MGPSDPEDPLDPALLDWSADEQAKEQSVRAALHPWYFAYSMGKWQILALREEAKRGRGYTLQRFHDALLSHGQGPVGLIRPRVLSDLGLPSSG